MTVKAQNIPDGTPVRLRVSSSSALITKPAQGESAVTLAGGTASFTLTVPKGTGTIQAFADIKLKNP